MSRYVQVVRGFSRPRPIHATGWDQRPWDRYRAADLERLQLQLDPNPWQDDGGEAGGA